MTQPIKQVKDRDGLATMQEPILVPYDDLRVAIEELFSDEKIENVLKKSDVTESSFREFMKVNKLESNSNAQELLTKIRSLKSPNLASATQKIGDSRTQTSQKIVASTRTRTFDFSKIIAKKQQGVRTRVVARRVFIGQSSTYVKIIDAVRLSGQQIRFILDEAKPVIAAMRLEERTGATALVRQIDLGGLKISAYVIPARARISPKIVKKLRLKRHSMKKLNEILTISFPDDTSWDHVCW